MYKYESVFACVSMCVCELTEDYLTVDLCWRAQQDNLSGLTALVPSQSSL